MLVLSRRPEEWVGIEISREEALAILDEIGKIRIDVMLVQLQREKVRLGFACDKRVTVHRQEIWDEIHLRLKKKAEAPALVQAAGGAP